MLIQMSGAPGSGKSTLARLLRPSLNATIIDHDVLRSSLLESDIIPFDQAAKQAYQLQWALAQDLMKQNISSVIIDSTCNYAETLNQGTSLAAKNGYVYYYIECRADSIDLLDERMRARQPMTSQRSAVNCPPAAAVEQGNSTQVEEDARALFTRWIENPCRPDDTSCVIVVDSSTPVETLREQVLTRLT